MKRLLLCALALASAISVQAQGVLYSMYLDGPSESPPNASPGTGSGSVLYDSVTHSLQIIVNWSGLTGTTTAAHIHAATVNPNSGTAGVAVSPPSLPGFPAGVTSGSYSNTLDLTQSSVYHPNYLSANGGTAAGAEAALASAMASGRAYFNIHSSTFGGGEIRGFLTPVPEPSSLALMGLGGLLVFALRRKCQRD